MLSIYQFCDKLYDKLSSSLFDVLNTRFVKQFGVSLLTVEGVKMFYDVMIQGIVCTEYRQILEQDLELSDTTINSIVNYVLNTLVPSHLPIGPISSDAMFANASQSILDSHRQSASSSAGLKTNSIKMISLQTPDQRETTITFNMFDLYDKYPNGDYDYTSASIISKYHTMEKYKKHIQSITFNEIVFDGPDFYSIDELKGLDDEVVQFIKEEDTLDLSNIIIYELDVSLMIAYNISLNKIVDTVKDLGKIQPIFYDLHVPNNKDEDITMKMLLLINKDMYKNKEIIDKIKKEIIESDNIDEKLETNQMNIDNVISLRKRTIERANTKVVVEVNRLNRVIDKLNKQLEDLEEDRRRLERLSTIDKDIQITEERMLYDLINDYIIRSLRMKVIAGIQGIMFPTYFNFKLSSELNLLKYDKDTDTFLFYIDSPLVASRGYLEHKIIKYFNMLPGFTSKYVRSEKIIIYDKDFTMNFDGLEVEDNVVYSELVDEDIWKQFIKYLNYYDVYYERIIYAYRLLEVKLDRSEVSNKLSSYYESMINSKPILIKRLIDLYNFNDIEPTKDMLDINKFIDTHSTFDDVKSLLYEVLQYTNDIDIIISIVEYYGFMNIEIDDIDNNIIKFKDINHLDIIKYLPIYLTYVTNFATNLVKSSAKKVRSELIEELRKYVDINTLQSNNLLVLTELTSLSQFTQMYRTMLINDFISADSKTNPSYINVRAKFVTMNGLVGKLDPSGSGTKENALLLALIGNAVSSIERGVLRGEVGFTPSIYTGKTLSSNDVFFNDVYTLRCEGMNDDGSCSEDESFIQQDQEEDYEDTYVTFEGDDQLDIYNITSDRGKSDVILYDLE